MEGILTRELQKYFRKEKGAYVFKNGMSLNDLSLEMWERLGCREMDASALSRIIRGERLFTARQMEVFCDVLRVSDFEKLRLVKALRCEISKRFGFDNENMDSYIALIEKFNENVLKIRKARKLGDPDLAWSWVNMCCREINALAPCFSGVFGRELWRVYGKLLVEKLWLLADTAFGEELKRETLSVAKVLRRVSGRIHDPGFKIKADVLVRNMYYLCGNYKKSIYLGKINWNFENAIFYEGLLLRNNILAFAYLGRREEFRMVREEVIEKLSLFPLNISCMALEGIARAEAFLSCFDEALETLHLCKKICEYMEKVDGDYEKLRKIQIASTELYLSLRTGNKRNAKYMSKYIGEMMLVARDRGYIRNAQEMKKMTQGFID